MLITNGKIVTWGEETRILEGQALRIDSGIIAELGPQDRLVSEYRRHQYEQGRRIPT